MHFIISSCSYSLGFIESNSDELGRGPDKGSKTFNNCIQVYGIMCSLGNEIWMKLSCFEGEMVVAVLFDDN